MINTPKFWYKQDLISKSKKIKEFKEYVAFLKSNKIIFDHNERQKIILKRFKAISKTKIIKKIII